MSVAIEQFDRDDLVEVHNELFPETPCSADDTGLDIEKLAAAIRTHLADGLLAEELVDLWNVVFPADRNVWYDADDDALHVNEEPEFVGSTE